MTFADSQIKKRFSKTPYARENPLANEAQVLVAQLESERTHCANGRIRSHREGKAQQALRYGLRKGRIEQIIDRATDRWLRREGKGI